MLLVACAVSARTTLVACGDNHYCNGFYMTDAMANQDVSPQDAYSGCLGFYPNDANLDVAFEAAPDASADASDEVDANLDATDAADE